MKLNLIISILILPFFVFSQTKQNQEIDSLLSVWEDTSFHDSLRADAFQTFIYKKYFRTDLDSAKLLSEEHLRFTKQSKIGKSILNSYLLNAMVSSRIGDYKSAIDYSYEALYDKECENKWRCQATFHNTLGNIFTFMGEDEKALKQYNVAINLQTSNNGDSSTIGFLYSNIGNIYQSIDKDSALYFFYKSLEIQTALNDKFRIAQVNWNIGNTFSDNPRKQIPYYKESLEFFKKLNYKTYLSSLANNIAIAYNKLDDIKNAEKYAKICYQNALETNSSLELIKAYKINYSIEQKKGNFSKALSFYESATLINDSLNRASNRKAMHESEIKYEYKKKAVIDSLSNLESQKVQLAQIKVHDLELDAGRNFLLGVAFILFLIVVLSIILFIKYQKSNEQKDLIQQQKSQVDKAYSELELNKIEIEKKTLETLESIEYARYIQRSLHPEEEKLTSFFDGYFVFNLPKDIVGGDFHWFKSNGDKAIVIAADCTGHGVPGGFITMLGSLLISNTIDKQLKNPDEILIELNRELVSLLKQNEENSIQDGMDISICLVDKKKKTIQFSGARNGIFIINNETVEFYKGSLNPVGGFYTKKEKLKERIYNLTEIKLKKNDYVVMCTDGFYDQFGGDKGMPMGIGKFEEILKDSVKRDLMSPSEYKNYFFKWMGNFPQLDDVLVLGFKI